MVTLAPLTGHHVADDHAASVVTPPYDALTPSQREALAAADPDSFLNVLPSGGSDTSGLDSALVACRDALQRLLAEGRFVALPDDVLAVVAAGDGARRAVGIVGDVAVAAFADGRILPHERVQASRVAALTRYLDVVGVSSSPVCVTHQPDPEVTAAVVPIIERPPDVAFHDEDGSDVALWVVTDATTRHQLADAVAQVDRLYIADGHHRAAAIARHADHLARVDRGGGTRPPSRVLTAVVPADQLRILPFHRLVALPDLDVATLSGRLAERGLRATSIAGPSEPTEPGTFHIALDGEWLRVDARERRRSGPVESLDIRLVGRELLAPLLATDDVDHDGRAIPVPPTVGLSALVRPGHLGVALHPPSIHDLIEVAEGGASMPSKTTYVAPKLRSGLLLTHR